MQASSTRWGAQAIAAGALRRPLPPPWLRLDLPADSLPLTMMMSDDPRRHCSIGGRTRPWDSHRGCGGGKAVRLVAQLPGPGPTAAPEPRVSGEADLGPAQAAGGLSPAQIQRRARQAARQQARTVSCAQLAAARKRIDELQLQLTILVAAIKAGRCPLQLPGLETISEEVHQGAAPLQGDRGSPAITRAL